MAQTSSSVDTLLSPLSGLDTVGLQRPASMTLSAYLSQLATFAQIPKETVSPLLSAYYQLRFAQTPLPSESWEPSVQVLTDIVTTLQQAPTEQHKRWADTLQSLASSVRDPTGRSASKTTAPRQESTHVTDTTPTTPSLSPSSSLPQSLSSEHTTEKAQTSTDQAVATRVVISSKGTNFSIPSGVGSSAASIQLTSASSGSSVESKDRDSSAVPRKGTGVPDVETSEHPGRFRRWLSRPLHSHLWWIVVLFLGTSILLFRWGVIHSDRVMLRSYQIQNWISLFFGFPTMTIPDRYLPEHLRRNAHRNRYIRRLTQYIIRRHPNNARLWRRLAYYYQEQDKYAEAIAFYSRTLSLDPNHVGALNDLAWILCTADAIEYRDPIRALPLAERAYTLRKTADVTDTLAEAAFLNGQVSRAVELAKKAIALEPKEKHFREQLQRFQKAISSPKPR